VQSERRGWHSEQDEQEQARVPERSHQSLFAGVSERELAGSLQHGVGVRNNWTRRNQMLMLATATPILAAGWSLLYLLFGGGLGGALLIFLGLKVLGR
jgi:hypothetical protein